MDPVTGPRNRAVIVRLPDQAKAARVTAVMLATKKFDIAALHRAYNAD